MEELKLFFGQVCEGCIAEDNALVWIDSKIPFSIPSAHSWLLVSMLTSCLFKHDYPLFIFPTLHKLFNNSMTHSV